MTSSELFVLHACATVAMTGLIWMVQLVHYPLFVQVGRMSFRRYHHAHTMKISLIVLPLMLTELLTGVALMLNPPVALSAEFISIGLGLLALIWLSTIFIQVPQHRALSTGFRQDHYENLVLGNWLRTWLWTARSCLCGFAFLTLLP